MSNNLTKPDYPSESAFLVASNLLNVDIKVIKSFAKVESGTYGAFLDNGEPVILYERHTFHRLTKGKYENKPPAKIKGEFYTLSYPSPGGYGPVSIQHAKLRAAAILDRDAALKSCSWGLFQLMGENYSLCSHSSLQSFINAMYNHVDDHLTAFCHFVLNNKKKVRGKLLIEALRSNPPDYTPDYEVASLIYNGPKAINNGYHIKFRKAYEALV